MAEEAATRGPAHFKISRGRPVSSAAMSVGAGSGAEAPESEEDEQDWLEEGLVG
jgi:hypothetical protein